MLPPWLQEKLASPPDAGTGLHAWLFSVARQLHAHMPADSIEAVLQAATTNAGRIVTKREIRDAVSNSVGVAWQRNEIRGGAREKRLSPKAVSAPDSVTQSWPEVNEAARVAYSLASANEGILGLADLWEASPIKPSMSVDDWLDWLFPGAEWLCLAIDHPATARSRRREKWYFTAEEYGLIVPSPMTGPSGIGLDGERSHRCLDNTGPRRWLVIEFDSGSIDEQARLHWHFRSAALAIPEWPKLTLCVHSGGKSLHGWYGPVESEESAFDFMAYAASLGADTATWNRCQLIRLPGGRRSAGIPADPWSDAQPFTLQNVFFFDPYAHEQSQLSQAESRRQCAA